MFLRNASQYFVCFHHVPSQAAQQWSIQLILRMVQEIQDLLGCAPIRFLDLQFGLQGAITGSTAWLWWLRRMSCLLHSDKKDLLLWSMDFQSSPNWPNIANYSILPNWARFKIVQNVPRDSRRSLIGFFLELQRLRQSVPQRSGCVQWIPGPAKIVSWNHWLRAPCRRF